MYCEHCGTQIMPENKFCPQCGEPSSSESPAPKKRKWWFWVLVGIALILAVLFLLGRSISLPGETITEQLRSLREGQLTEAYYGFTSKDFQKTVPLEVFKKYIKTNPILEKNKSFILEDEGIVGDISTIRGYVVAEDGSSIEAVYKLILEDDEWKIFSISPIVRGEAEKTSQTTITKQMLDPVVVFLNTLRKPEFPQIFQSKVSKYFIQNTPYDQFQKFIDKNSILTNFTEYEIVEHELNRGRGELLVLLNPQADDIPFAFTVVKEDGVWKIFRMALGSAKEEAGLKSTELFERELIPFIKTSAQMLKNGNIAQFYQNNTAREFQTEVDLHLFNEFVKEYPVLSQYTELTVKDKGEIGDLAWVDLQFTKGGASKVVEFTLGKDEGEWKIWGIRMNEENSPNL